MSLHGTKEVTAGTSVTRPEIAGNFRDYWVEGREADLQWFAVNTRARVEYATAELLIGKGYEVVLPSRTERKQLCDRVKTVKKPLFPSYLFCRFDASVRLPVLTTPGVLSIVGSGREPVPIPDEEIEQLTRVLTSSAAIETCHYVAKGQLVQVTTGALKGLQGIVLSGGDRPTIVVSIQLLRRSIAVQLDRAEIQLI